MDSMNRSSVRRGLPRKEMLDTRDPGQFCEYEEALERGLSGRRVLITNDGNEHEIIKFQEPEGFDI